MSEAILDIKAWGNNLGVRLPAAVARVAKLHANQRVKLTVEDGRVIITPQRDKPLSLSDRLALFDPALHGGEAMAAKPVGRRSVVTRAAAKGWVPARQDVIWIDCNPQVGAEMRDLHPMLVLSPQAFNAKTGLVIGLPMTTAEYNASNPFAIAAALPPAAKRARPATCCVINPSRSTGVLVARSHIR